jgi:hypothetical protein
MVSRQRRDGRRVRFAGRGAERRRAAAYGKPIYAVSAPLAVEAIERILTGRIHATGVASAGRIFDTPDFLSALAPHIVVTQAPR